MKHLELLSDPDSIARGNELTNAYLTGFQTFVQLCEEHFPKPPNDFSSTVEKLTDAALQHEMDDIAYALLGRQILDAKRALLSKRVSEFGAPTEVWDFAFKPAHDIMDQHAHSPAAISALEGCNYPIWSMRLLAAQHPRRVGGFIIPSVIGNAQAYMATRPNSADVAYRVQIFDQGRPQVQIALAPAA